MVEFINQRDGKNILEFVSKFQFELLGFFCGSELS